MNLLCCGAFDRLRVSNLSHRSPRAIDNEFLSDFKVGGLKVIPCFQLVNTDMIFLCYSAERLTFLHNMDASVGYFLHLFLQFLLIDAAFCFEGINIFLITDESINILFRQLKHILLFICCGDDAFLKLRVKEPQVFHRYSKHLVKLVEM